MPFHTSESRLGFVLFCQDTKERATRRRARNSQRHLTDQFLIPVTQLGDTGDLKRKNKSLPFIYTEKYKYFLPFSYSSCTYKCTMCLHTHNLTHARTHTRAHTHKHVREEGHSGKGTWEKKREPTEARRDRLLRHSCNFPVVSRLVNSR